MLKAGLYHGLKWELNCGWYYRKWGPEKRYETTPLRGLENTLFKKIPATLCQYSYTVLF